ncbi:tRNA1Val (adenine37-N6)-methyltransferase [Tindallia magadiensis]|uniref:tRNA1Val (Adenine37-N6)-methyltransferase n=1 Tax=Tindallia magadiensis TaxID=69895 RepID=A0A1I3CWV6_9FIRM|nr:tRNA1(Val) (adenine(37)-N6)-methyltransferase [Tindallia magadiensis]SFH78858.1 tRNA1Val (adenine37-N6)-methyltransferase [Tindallia magadiensis]
MKEQWLKPGERLDDLQCQGFHLIQDPKSFCFGMDAVLISHFAEIRTGDQVMDLCTGNGVIPILLAGKKRKGQFTAVEIQEEASERAQRNVQMNGLEDRIKVVKEDVKNIASLFSPSSFDVVVSNPPYLAADGLKNPRQDKAIARHEVMMTLRDLMVQTAYLLKPGGRFYLVHRPDRLVDMMTLSRQNRLEAKWMQMVHPRQDKKPNLVLVQFVKNARPELKLKKPLFVYDKEGNYTPELLECYQS